VKYCIALKEIMVSKVWEGHWLHEGICCRCGLGDHWVGGKQLGNYIPLTMIEKLTTFYVVDSEEDTKYEAKDLRSAEGDDSERSHQNDVDQSKDLKLLT
jgi:hypothetical protein